MIVRLCSFHTLLFSAAVRVDALDVGVLLVSKALLATMWALLVLVENLVLLEESDKGKLLHAEEFLNGKTPFLTLMKELSW